MSNSWVALKKETEPGVQTRTLRDKARQAVMKNQGYSDLLMCFEDGDRKWGRIRVRDRNTTNNNLLETQDST